LTKFQAKVRFDFAKKWLKPGGLENAMLSNENMVPINSLSKNIWIFRASKDKYKK